MKRFSALAFLTSLLLWASASCGGLALKPNMRGSSERDAWRIPGETFLVNTNGLRGLVLPTDNTNLVTVSVRYHAGSARDPAGKDGLAHVAEHVSFFARDPESGHRIQTLLAEVTLYSNAFTSRDHTEFIAMGFASSLEKILRAEALRMTKGCRQIDDESFELERKVVLNELAQRDSQTDEIMAAIYRQSLGADHGYGHTMIGAKDTLAKIDRADACEFIAENYVASNALLIVGGNVDVATVKKLTARVFGRAPKRPAPSQLADVELGRISGSGVLAIAADVSQPTAVVAFPAPLLLSPSAATGSLATALLREYLRDNLLDSDSMLGVKMWERMGGRHAPITLVTVTARSASDLGEAVDAVFDGVSEVRRGTHWNLAPALQGSMRSALITDTESLWPKVQIFADYASAGDEELFILRPYRGLARVDQRAVAAYATTYLNRKNALVAKLTPTKDFESGTNVLPLIAPRPVIDEADYHREQIAVPSDDPHKPLRLPHSLSTPESEHYVLPNGLQVVLAHSERHPALDIRLVVKVGGQHDPEDKRGLALSTVRRLEPDWNAIHFREWLSAVASTHVASARYAYVDEHSSTLRVRGLSVHQNLLLWRLYWWVLYGHIDDERLAEEQALTQRRETSRDGLDEDDLRHLLDGEYETTANPQRLRECFLSLSADDLEEFYERYYIPQRSVLIVSGKFDKEGIRREIERLFGSWGGGELQSAPPVRSAAPTLASGYVAIPDAEATRVTFGMAFPLTRADPERWAARYVVREMLERQAYRVRKHLGATYHVETQLDYEPGDSTLTVLTSVEESKAARVFALLREELEELRGNSMTSEFLVARRRVVQSRLGELTDSESVAETLKKAFVFGRDEGFDAQTLRHVAALTVDDVHAAIADDLAESAMLFVVRGREKLISKVLEADGVRDVRWVSPK